MSEFITILLYFDFKRVNHYGFSFFFLEICFSLVSKAISSAILRQEAPGANLPFH